MDEDQNERARREAGQNEGGEGKKRETDRRRGWEREIELKWGTERKVETGKTEETLEEHIIWPLPPSGKAANGSGWVPTIPVTLEVSWRKAALIKLTPRLRRMIAGSNAHNNYAHIHIQPTAIPSTPTTPSLLIYTSTSLHIYLYFSSHSFFSLHYTLFSFASLSLPLSISLLLLLCMP